jgi:hypothetical protein
MRLACWRARVARAWPYGVRCFARSIVDTGMTWCYLSMSSSRVQELSHKLLRWATPFLFLAVLGPAILLSASGQPVARGVLVLQVAWLAAAVVGHLALHFHVRIPVVAAAYELALENIGILIGVTRAILGHREIAYRPGGR